MQCRILKEMGIKRKRLVSEADDVWLKKYCFPCPLDICLEDEPAGEADKEIIDAYLRALKEDRNGNR